MSAGIPAEPIVIRSVANRPLLRHSPARPDRSSRARAGRPSLGRMGRSSPERTDPHSPGCAGGRSPGCAGGRSPNGRVEQNAWLASLSPCLVPSSRTFRRFVSAWRFARAGTTLRCVTSPSGLRTSAPSPEPPAAKCAPSREHLPGRLHPPTQGKPRRRPGWRGRGEKSRC